MINLKLGSKDELNYKKRAAALLKELHTNMTHKQMHFLSYHLKKNSRHK